MSTRQSLAANNQHELAAGRNYAFKIAVKPLQIETWLLLKSRKNSHRSFHADSCLWQNAPKLSAKKTFKIQ